MSQIFDTETLKKLKDLRAKLPEKSPWRGKALKIMKKRQQKQNTN